MKLCSLCKAKLVRAKTGVYLCESCDEYALRQMKDRVPE